MPVGEAIRDREVRPDEHEIRGYMTLEQVAAASGVSIDELRQRLGLSESVDNQEKVGRLLRGQGSDVPVVRRAVADLRASAAR